MGPPSVPDCQSQAVILLVEDSVSAGEELHTNSVQQLENDRNITSLTIEDSIESPGSSTVCRPEEPQTSWSTPKRRITPGSRMRSFRYLGDFSSPSHIRSPSKARAYMSLVASQMASKNASLKRISQKNRRLTKRVASLEAICKELKKKGLLSDHASDLLVATSSASEFLRRGVLQARPHKYSPELRSFALTLQFYSPKAYNYVRNNFKSCLPHESTLRKWYGALDCSAGITWSVEPLLTSLVKEKPVLCCMSVDEMAIRQHIQWDGSKWSGVVDLGTGLDVNDQTPPAKDALVVMLTAVNGSWKLPVAYYFVNSITGREKSFVIKSVLEFVSNCGIVVIGITFDGATSNVTMGKELGARYSIRNLYPWFSFKDQKIATIWDPSHMVKLVRNAFATYDVRNKGGEIISWSYIVWLHECQERNEVHVANKLTVRHIHWFREKMKVKLAAQTLSISVADALDYLRTINKDLTFVNSEPTSKFLRVFDKLFDILNSRNLMARGSKKPLSNTNAAETFTFFEYASEYISGLSINGKNILTSKRRTGFLGFLICMKVVKNIYFEHIKVESPKIDFLITYKLSQDHLELFFGAVRSKGGYNNNPTAIHFEAAYKRLLTHRRLLASKGANCVPLDETDILCVSAEFKKNVYVGKINLESQDENHEESLHHENSVDHDHNYFSPNISLLSELQSDVVAYIAGFVENHVKRKLKCEGCIKGLDGEERDVNALIDLKNRGGLKVPSKSIVYVCRVAEKTFREHEAKGGLLYMDSKRMTCATFGKIVSNCTFPLFPCLDEHSKEQEFLDCHKLLVIKSIIFQFIQLRLFHFSKKKRLNMKPFKSRSMLTKAIHFKGD